MDTKLIKQLRDETGYGMLDIKEALTHANGDLDKARAYLQSLKKEVSSHHRVASKGLTSVVTLDNDAILFEINGETDFLAKHPAFIELIQRVGTLLISSTAVTLKQALSIKDNEKTVQALIEEVSLITKENLTLRRFFRIKKQPSHVFTTYKHQQGKLSILLITAKEHILNNDLALHITSHAPIYLAYHKLDQETLAFEKMRYQKEHDTYNEKVFIEHLKSLSLYDQPFIKQPDKTINELISENHIIDFYRFELGQGIDNKLNCRLDIPCDGSKITVTPL